jgi:hypothetical protein
MDIIVGFLMGVAASFVAAMLWDRRLLLKHRFISIKHRDSNALGFDPTSVGLFVINQWSPARPLDRKHLITIVLQVALLRLGLTMRDTAKSMRRSPRSTRVQFAI